MPVHIDDWILNVFYNAFFQSLGFSDLSEDVNIRQLQAYDEQICVCSFDTPNYKVVKIPSL